MKEDTCSVKGCDNPIKRKGFCYSHYMRVWRYGDPESRVRFNPSGTITSNGYRRLHGVHPVLKVPTEHRVKLFDSVGYGPHQCDECSRHINWQMQIPHRLCVDHIDEDKLNNDLSNLRKLCHSCNIRRNREQLPSGAGFAPRYR
jgi:hypothetical protein